MYCPRVEIQHYRGDTSKIGVRGIPACRNEGGRGGLCWNIGMLRPYMGDRQLKNSGEAIPPCRNEGFMGGLCSPRGQKWPYGVDPLQTFGVKSIPTCTN